MAAIAAPRSSPRTVSSESFFIVHRLKFEPATVSHHTSNSTREVVNATMREPAPRQLRDRALSLKMGRHHGLTRKPRPGVNVTADSQPRAAPGLLDGLRAFYLRSDAAKGYALLSPVLITMVVLLAAPLILLTLYSFWTRMGFSVDPTFTLDRYKESVADPYPSIFLRTLETSGLVTLVTVGLAYPIAYYVAFGIKNYKFVWLILLTIPFWTSYLLRVFAWKVILGFNGVINSGLISLGLIHEPLQFLLYNQTAVVITLAHAYAAFAILPIYVSLEKIDRTLLEAAADLGDSAWSRFWRVTFPLSLPGVIGAAVLIFVPTTGDYVTPQLVGGPTGQMIGYYIQVAFLKLNDWPLGAALALSAMAMVAILAMLFVSAMQLAVRRIR
jgi:spermidine/putrescine transport system permease protein